MGPLGADLRVAPCVDTGTLVSMRSRVEILLRRVPFLLPPKVVVGWQGSGDECSEAEKEESIYSEEESGSEAAEDVPATYGG